MAHPTTTYRPPDGLLSRAAVVVAAATVIAFGWLAGAAAHDVANGTLAAAIRAGG